MNGNHQDDQVGAPLPTPAVDWEDVRQRIAAAGQALAGMNANAPGVYEQILARRAAQLARAQVREDVGEQVEMVLFWLGSEVYAVEAQYVFDIRRAEHITRVPRVPEWVAGVVNLRGRILSVLDVQRFLGLPRHERRWSDDLTSLYLIVVETPTMETSLLVDDVLAVEALPVRKIQEASGVIRSIRPEYLRGVFVRQAAAENAPSGPEQMSPIERGGKAEGSIKTSPHDGEGVLVVILNLPVLLADKHLMVHEEIV